MKKILPGISQIIHTKNEERNIRDCILSAKELVDEVIVIDMSSTDKTVKIAKSLGAKVISIPDKGFVDDYRNWGFTKTKLPWIISFDADERLTKNQVRIFRKVIEEDKYDVIIAPRKNIRFNKWIKHGGFWPDAQPIIWKKGFLTWPQKITQAHILPIVKGRVLRLESKEENAFVHYNAENLKHYLSKFVEYATAEGNGEFFNQKNITFQHLINYCEGEFRFRYFDEKGYLDGMRGFVFAKFREFYKFVEFVNWWEEKGYPEIFSQEQIQRNILEKQELANLHPAKFVILRRFLDKVINLF